MPTSKLEGGGFQHPSRLPLGAGWNGLCCAQDAERISPSENELREFCNMGYALTCSRLPSMREWDAVRFSVTRDWRSHLSLQFVCEMNHTPSEHGKLEYDVTARKWTTPHKNSRVQKMAECYVESYLLRQSQKISAINSLDGPNA
ncbi:MAG: hypothetical protein M3O09_19740 [Acidobacteriota bacterium]|nr:hypothetical protein [Acidobacteriota bacterium]